MTDKPPIPTEMSAAAFLLIRTGASPEWEPVDGTETTYSDDRANNGLSRSQVFRRLPSGEHYRFRWWSGIIASNIRLVELERVAPPEELEAPSAESCLGDEEDATPEPQSVDASYELARKAFERFKQTHPIIPGSDDYAFACFLGGFGTRSLDDADEAPQAPFAFEVARSSDGKANHHRLSISRSATLRDAMECAASIILAMVDIDEWDVDNHLEAIARVAVKVLSNRGQVQP